MNKPLVKIETDKPRAKHSYWAALLAAAVVAGAFFLVSQTSLKDRLLALTFRLTAAVSDIQSALQLTDDADLIFRASRPELQSAADFNSHCPTRTPDDSVLGCYTSGQIYVYNIESDELAGIVESTTAHELLHAIWERLGGGEKSRLLELLNQVYQAHAADLTVVETYEQSARASELYARIGTEIADLPAELEQHYARYFQNRAKILQFYHNYIAVFSEETSALRLLLTEIDLLATQIQLEESTYENRAATFARETEDFNACARQPGCFTDAAFKVRRAELLAEQAALDALYAELSAHIDHHNQLVEEYNSHLLHEQDLIKLVNSNQRKDTNEQTN